MQRQARGSLAVLAVVSLAILGCGEADPGVPVSGSVRMGGQPQDGVRIYFIPGSEQAQIRGAITDAAGKFVAKVPPGQYKVTLSRMVDRSGKVPGESENPEEDFTQLEASGLLRQTIPSQYLGATTTPLSVDIPEEGKELEPFEVTQ